MKRALKALVRRRWVPSVAGGIVRLLGGTWLIQTRGERNFRRGQAEGRPLIGAFFHGRHVPVMYYMSLPDNRPWTIMISFSRDGDLLAGVMTRLGYHVVRGSSGHGGSRALVGLIRQGKRRPTMPIAMAVDGSRGPRGRVQLGLVLLAKKTGGVILPVTASCRKSRVLTRSWDRMVIPRPYARVHVACGELIRVPRDSDSAQLERYRLQVERSLLAITREADRQAGFADGAPLQAPLP